jgi:hypothetical protein
VPDTASSAELEVLTTQRLAGDFCRLHPALGLKPWEPSPLPLDVDKAEPPDGGAIRGVRACGRRGNRAAPWMWPSVTAFRTSASIALTNVLGARTGWGVYCLGRMAFALWPQIVAHAVAANRKNSPVRRAACSSGPICRPVKGAWHGLAGAGSEPAG